MLAREKSLIVKSGGGSHLFLYQKSKAARNNNPRMTPIMMPAVDPACVVAAADAVAAVAIPRVGAVEGELGP